MDGAESRSIIICFAAATISPTPVNPAPPVKVLIINELNGSAAETGAYMFKLGKVGSVVGKRTYGGGIGPYYFNPLRRIDKEASNCRTAQQI